MEAGTAALPLSPPLLLSLTLLLAALLACWFLKPPSKSKSAGTPPAGTRKIADLPGPPGWPVLGNLLEISERGYHLCHLEWMRRYGPMFRYTMGPLTVVVVSDPALVREMATLQFKSFHDRPVPPTAAPTSDKGLLFARGNYWAGLRASLTPSLHNDSQVPHLLPHMAQCSRSLIARLRTLAQTAHHTDHCTNQGTSHCADPCTDSSRELGSGHCMEHCRGHGTDSSTGCGTDSSTGCGTDCGTDCGTGFQGEVDILPLLEESALDAIGMSCFGAQQWHQPGPSDPSQSGAPTWASQYSELEKSSNNLGAATQLLLLLCPTPLRPYLRWVLSRIPGLKFRESLSLRASLFQEWQARLGARRKAPEASAHGSSQQDLVEPLSRACVKGTKDPLTDEDITAALFNLIGAGSGTTATTVACALHFLAANPYVQKEAASEVDRVLGGAQRVGSELSVEELGSMQFLDAVVKETLRLCPPGALLAREAGCDVILGGCLLPKGTPVLAPVYAMHRNEDYFGQPEKFLPQRFLDGQDGTSGRVSTSGSEGGIEGAQSQEGLWTPLSASAYVPFGLGPRMCLGQKYAMLESKLFLAMTLYYFHVGAPQDLKELTLAAGINLKPKHGVMLHFVERREHVKS